jgi:hypothetical protein
MGSVSVPNTWRRSASESLIGGIGFDRLMTVLLVWLLAGLHLDGWAHINVPGLETFFTPWHAVLYSGFFAVSAALVAVPVLNHRRGATWWNAIPAGYGAALAGVPLFLLGGAGDMTWHILFGVEDDIEALLSPTHLLLALSIMLFITGPIRAAYNRLTVGERQSGWKFVLPLLIALSLLMSLFAFFTQYASPFSTILSGGTLPQDLFADVAPEISGELTEIVLSLGVVAVLLQTALLMSLVLFAVRFWTLPFGSISVILGLSTLLMTAMQGQSLGIPPMILFGVGLGAGLVSDLLLAYLKPGPKRNLAFRVFAFSVPITLYSLYFATIALTAGVWWTIHVWTGAIVLAGLVGVLVSYLLLPPASPAADSARVIER